MGVAIDSPRREAAGMVEERFMNEITCSFIVEGQRAQNANRWDAVGAHPTEAQARADEKDYREFTESRKGEVGWLDFRVVRETTTREVLPKV